MLFDRWCNNCDHVEIDRIEWVDQGTITICPMCAQETFEKSVCAPGIVTVAGSGSALEFGNMVDTRREKSRTGHGNTRIRATADANGRLTIDGVDHDH